MRGINIRSSLEANYRRLRRQQSQPPARPASPHTTRPRKTFINRRLRPPSRSRRYGAALSAVNWELHRPFPTNWLADNAAAELWCALFAVDDDIWHGFAMGMSHAWQQAAHRCVCRRCIIQLLWSTLPKRIQTSTISLSTLDNAV